MKAIRLTRHARNRMRWHQISEEQIRATLQAPDWEEASVAGRIIAGGAWPIGFFAYHAGRRGSGSW